MSEVDYQMALLLQYKFDKEHNHTQNTSSDQQLALELQQQFQAEAEIERPSNNLVYKAPALNTSKCLVDPSWEVIDPTPDIHVLFMAFNQKFFWNTLGSVTVTWSKKMTTCAGVCSYQGRGGMCSITLSEPLLKLRPRKDLVETLLHEMIHAYLFVTNNNRDRDGHGPEFHKHMYRINAEAGTNITVYHDFHDEVKLYKQHWWRCDGPCQTKKPYFGMIRRATNRAPGSNDRWWDEHVRNCGGSFIKVKSPEKPDKPKTRKSGNSKTPDPKNDIRKYIPTSNKAPIPTPTESNKENKALPNSTQNPGFSKAKGTSTLISNIHTVSNSSDSSAQVSNVIPSKTNNIFGFTNLNGNTGTSGIPKKPGNTSGIQKAAKNVGNTSSMSDIPKRPSSTSGIKGAVKNAGSSTFVVTKKGGKSLNTTNDMAVKSITNNSSNVQIFSGTGRSLSSGSCPSSSSADYSRVREHWLKKFENTNQTSNNETSVKRPNTNPPSSASKVPRLSRVGIYDVECPVCKKTFEENEMNNHLDTCLEAPSLDTKKCFICSAKLATASFDRHLSDCSGHHFKDNFDDDGDVFTDLTQCPKCLKEFDQKSYAKHKEHCEESINSIDLTRLDSVEETKNCPVCKAALSPTNYNLHVAKCILKMCDELDQKYETCKDIMTLCLACNKEILKSELNSHLEDCLSITKVFETSTEVIDFDDESDNDVDKSVCDNNDSYNCPFCLKLVLEKEMQGHLDRCLHIEDCTEENIKEKSLLVESLCSTDSDME